MAPSLHAAVIAARVATDRSGSIYAISWQRIIAEAALYWPKHTAKRIATITDYSVRQAYRWLAGDSEPPAGALVAIVRAMRIEHEARGRMFEQFDLDLG